MQLHTVNRCLFSCCPVAQSVIGQSNITNIVLFCKFFCSSPNFNCDASSRLQPHLYFNIQSYLQFLHYEIITVLYNILLNDICLFAG